MGLVACAQWSQSGKFQLYDYGSSAANRAHYGVPAPPDIAGNYKLLDIPVDIMAGASLRRGQPHVSTSFLAGCAALRTKCRPRRTASGMFAGKRLLGEQNSCLLFLAPSLHYGMLEHAQLGSVCYRPRRRRDRARECAGALCAHARRGAQRDVQGV